MQTSSLTLPTKQVSFTFNSMLNHHTIQMISRFFPKIAHNIIKIKNKQTNIAGSTLEIKPIQAPLLNTTKGAPFTSDPCQRRV